MARKSGFVLVAALMFALCQPGPRPTRQRPPSPAAAVEAAPPVVTATAIEVIEELAIPASTPERVAPGAPDRPTLKLPGGVIVDFRRDGMQFLSKVTPEPTYFDYRLESVKMGGNALYEATKTSAQATQYGSICVFQRGCVTEVYRPVGGDLEQIFVIPVKPAGSGDLVVSGRTQTNLQPVSVTPDAITLGHRGQAQFRIDQAVAIDADGRSQAVAMDYGGNRMSLTVPAAWLSGARYPIVVDPMLGTTPFAVNVYIRRLASNNLHHLSGGQFLAISTDFGPDPDVTTGRLLSGADGSIIASIPEFSLPFPPDDISYLSSAGRYLATYGDIEGILAVLIDPSTNPVTVTDLGEVYSRASAGTVSQNLYRTCNVARTGGWAVGFTCESFDSSTGLYYDTAEVLTLTSTGAVATAPVELNSVLFDWTIFDHYWWRIRPHCALHTVNATATERFAITWSDDHGYDGTASLDYWAIWIAGATINTMAPTSSRIVEEIYADLGGSGDPSYVNYPNITADDLADEFLVTWDRGNTFGFNNTKGDRSTTTCASVGGTFYFRGSDSNTTEYYYTAIKGAQFVATRPGGTPATADKYLIFFTTGTDAKYIELASGSSSPSGTDIEASPDASDIFAYFMCVNPADTRTMMVFSDATALMYEMQSVPPPPVITTVTLPGATYNVAYSQTLAASGGTGSPNWTITSGALPGGLSIGLTTGTISGTPTGPDGSFNFTVQLTTTSGTDTQILTIVVSGSPAGGGGGGGGKKKKKGGCAAGESGAFEPVLFALILLLGIRRFSRPS